MVHELPKELTHNNNNNENGNGNGKKFAVLLCAEDSQYLQNKYDGKYGLFVSMLSEEGESWDVFRAMRNEFPNDDEIQMYDGFVLTGSIHNAYSNDLWISNLLSLLQKLDFFKKKILGICFGHQILGRLLGGKIVQASSGWDLGLRTIHFSPSSYKAFSSLKIPSTLNIIQCHQDVILEMPAKVEVIGVSNKTSIEMFRYGDHMLGIQGHPEYNRDILAHLIGILRQKDLIGVNYADKMLAKCMESRDPDKEGWRKLCVSFLKGRS